MQDNFEYKDLSIDYKEQIGMAQQAVECSIDTASKGGVSKLLSVCADATVGMVERSGQEVKLGGSINYKVICLNTEGMLDSYDYICDFSATAKVENCDKYTALCAKACVLDIDSSISNGNIVLQTVVDINVFGERNQQYKALVSVPSNTLADYKDIGIQTKTAKVDATFTITEEYESGVNIGKVLLFDSDIIGCNTLAQDGMLVVSGEIIATVVYESGGGINTKNFNIPFSEEISAQSTSYNRAEICMSITSSKIILAGVEDDNIIRLEIVCRAEGSVYENSEVTIVRDVCSFTSELTIKECEVKYDKYIGEQCNKEKIAGSAELEENMVGIRKILSACLSRNCITASVAEDGNITVEGIMACSAIYEDVNMAIDSLQIELPYSLVFPSDKVSEDSIVNVNAIVEILSAKVRRDREIEVTALINIQSKIKNEVEFDVIGEVKVGECKSIEFKAVTIYQSRVGESMWSIAKELGAPQEAIIAQNPSLASADSAQGQKIVFYRQILS